MSGHDLDGLDVIESQARVIQFAGEAVEVRPLTVGQLPAFARAVRPIVAGLQLVDVTPETIIDLLADHGDAMIQAVHVATGIPTDHIQRAHLDDMLALIFEVINANRDFLTGRLPAALQAAMSRNAPPSPGAGPTPSKP